MVAEQGKDKHGKDKHASGSNISMKDPGEQVSGKEPLNKAASS